MRNLFLALLLANLAFAAWRQWFAAPTETNDPAPDLPTIELASERPDPPADARTTATTPGDGDRDRANEAPADLPGADAPAADTPDADVLAADTPDALAADVPGTESPEPAAATPEQDPAQPSVAALPPARCVSVGPFRELAQAASAAATLRSGGYEPSQRAGEGDIWVGYWVYISSIPSREEAAAIVENLRQNGITDSYVIPDSDSGSLVSLGVFSEVARAGSRREEARTLGYEPVISDRTRRGTVYWVDVLLDGGQSLDFDLLQSPGRILRLEQRPCERGAA